MYNDWNSCSHCYLRQPGKNHHQYEYKIFNKYTYAGELKNELDARQMRGMSALTLELIRKEFTDPLSNQLTELSAAIGDLQGRVSGNYNVLSTWQGQGMCTGGQSIQLGNELHFFWDSDNEPCPRCLPQCGTRNKSRNDRIQAHTYFCLSVRIFNLYHGSLSFAFFSPRTSITSHQTLSFVLSPACRI